MDTNGAIDFDSYLLTITNLIGFGAAGGGTALLWQHARRKRRERACRAAGELLGLTFRSVNGAKSGVHLSGVYRGRALDAGFADGRAECSVLAINPARLIDSFSSEDPLPQTPWLSPACCETLSVLHDMGRRWKVDVQGRTLRLNCACVAYTPDTIRFLVDLSCDLAEGVDTPFQSNIFAVA